MPSSADGYLRSTTDHHGYILGEEADEYKLVATSCEVVGEQQHNTEISTNIRARPDWHDQNAMACKPWYFSGERRSQYWCFGIKTESAVSSWGIGISTPNKSAFVEACHSVPRP